MSKTTGTLHPLGRRAQSPRVRALAELGLAVALRLVLLAHDARAQASAALPTIDHADSDWIGAMRSRNVERIVAPYDRDGMFVTATGTVIRGRDSIATLYRRRLSAIKR